MDSGIILIGLTGLTYLLFENRYPHFYQLVAREEKQIKYKKSLIQGLSTDKIMQRLQELMEEEKIYRQFELKLDEVAAMLLITPHQLSEFINDYMGINFSSYVNKYRVEEARELLAANPDQSTLSIGMEVGFGSKPSFNTIFKQKTGMTPSEYRKKGSAL
jgi:AraC-like DNA-binding protein